MTTNYQIGGKDIDQVFVSRAYLMDRYPELALTFKAAGLWGWGNNSQGQLGDNTTVNKSSPVQTIAGGLNWKSISCGPNNIGGIKTNGQLWMWGVGASIGDNTVVAKSSPVQTIAGATTWQQVSVGNQYASAIKTDGTLWIWGINTSGQLGDNTSVAKSSPIQTVAAGTNWKLVSAGTAVGAIKRDGTLWTWGDNLLGSLGNNASGTLVSSPIQTVSGGSTWRSVAAGYRATAATKTDGTLWTWGLNNLGQLGDNTTVNKSSPIQTIASGTNWKLINATYYGMSSIKTDGTLWLWGSNITGQLGDNTTISKSSPIQTIGGGTNWVQVTNSGSPASNNYGLSAALKADGTLWTWGNNSNGQLGDNTTTNKSSPIQTAAGGYNWMQFSASGPNTYGIRDSALDYLYIPTIIPFSQTVNAVRNAAITSTTAFTASYFSGTITYSVSPSLPAGLSLNTSTGVISGAPTAAQDQASYVITATGSTSGVASAVVIITVVIAGTLWGWGGNDVGQIADFTTINRSSPVVVNSPSGNVWVTVANGNGHAAAIRTDGTLWSWGLGTNGQLGNSAITSRSSPVQTTAGGNNWRSVAAGGGNLSGYTLATKTDGTLWTWGANSNGQLGDQTTVNKSSPVQTIAGGSNWGSVVSTGVSNITSAAIKTDGTLWTWGNNSAGALGDSTTTNRSSPIQTVASGSTWTAVSIDNSTLAVKSDGTLWTWGSNGAGQLGDNTTISKSSPIQTIAGGSNWSSVVAGVAFMVAIKTDGTLWSWGGNGAGQLGDNTVVTKSSPIQTIAGGTNWRQVSAGSSTGNPVVSATKTDGTLWTWGFNYVGQLGDNTSGTTTSKSSPIQTIAGGTNWVFTSIRGGQTAFGIIAP